jgi:hypothetical protein
MYVNFLKHKTEPFFKIGKAIDIHSRLPNIGGSDSYDLEASCCLYIGDDKRSIHVERTLHKIISKWSTKDLGVHAGKEGHTEMFKADCFDRVIRFIAENHDLIGGHPTPEPLPTATIRSAQDNDRAELIAHQQRERIAVLTADNQSLYENFEYFLNEIKSTKLMIGLYQKALYYKQIITRGSNPADVLWKSPYKGLHSFDKTGAESGYWSFLTSRSVRVGSDHYIRQVHFFGKNFDLQEKTILGEPVDASSFPFAKEIFKSIEKIPVITQQLLCEKIGMTVNEFNSNFS